jgi:hypothetical protein
MRARSIVLASVVVVAAVAVVVATRGPAPPSANAPGTWAFAALGDAPYYPWEELQYRIVRQDLDASDLALVIHVGDIFWRPCTDDHYRQVLGWFDGLRHPVVYTPGDNETFDCWEEGAGGFAPQDRFAAVRRIFFSHPTRSLGARSIPLASQGGELVENARWTHEGLVFATVDLIGSRNGMKPFPGRTAADDEASRRRTEGATAWARETFAEATRVSAPAVVIAFHANPGLEDKEDPVYRQAFEPFLATLEEEAARFGRPVLMLHGDGHKYTVDHPLRPTNLTRVQVPGSPRVGWVKVSVHAGDAPAFAFERRTLPRWKYW